MRNLFRKIRQQLLNSRQMKQYSLYAIGEIILVVIGILIALQINSWNEQRKNSNKERTYLQNIKSDLELDLEMAKEYDKEWTRRIAIFKAIDPTFKLWAYLRNTTLPDIELDKRIDRVENARFVFTRGRRLLLRNGTYNAIKDNGEIGLITNEQLYLNIIKIYQNHTSGQQSTYEAIKKTEHELGLKYSKELKYMSLDEIFFKHPDKEEILADLEFYGRQFMLRQKDLRGLIKTLEDTIELIHQELNK